MSQENSLSSDSPEAKRYDLLTLFQRWLPTSAIDAFVQASGQAFYDRLLPPLAVLWGFIFQRVNPDHSCDAAWSYLTSETARHHLGLAPLDDEPISESNSAYCQARQRLPESVARDALHTTADAFSQELGEAARWHGRRVTLLDGSTLRLRATAALRAQYGGPTNQTGSSHWPMLRLVAGFDLFSGVAQAVVEGPYRMSEQSLAGQMLRSLGAGHLYVADSNFGIYSLLQTVTAVQSDWVVRLRTKVAQRLVRLNHLSLQDRLDATVTWSPSPDDTCVPDLPRGPVSGRLLSRRLERNGFRPVDLYLFTTLIEREVFPPAEVVALYGERWNVELDLRHVKTTLRMEPLDGHSVDIVRKELLLGLTAYNLERGLMGVAAVLAQRSPMELSLAQCVRRTLDASRSLTPKATPAQIAQVLDRLFVRLGRCVLPKRKRVRFEPRAVWGPPQSYTILKGSRDQARQKWMELLRTRKS